MDRTFSACLLLSAIPAVALGQAITFTVDGDIAPGSTITIGMSAGYGGLDYAIAGVATEVLINASQGAFDNLRLVAPMAGPGTTPGVLGIDRIDGILAGQLNFPEPTLYADPTNPIAFWEADFTIDSSLSGPVILDIETATTRYDVYIGSWTSRSESRLADLVEGELRIVIPAPAPGLALLGGLALTARRRR
jgi:hypothetical protein